MGKVYTVEIGFKNDEKHCLSCPIRDNDDSCNLQTYTNPYGKYNCEFDSWEDQMENCPLKLVSA